MIFLFPLYFHISFPIESYSIIETIRLVQTRLPKSVKILANKADLGVGGSSFLASQQAAILQEGLASFGGLNRIPRPIKITKPRQTLGLAKIRDHFLVGSIISQSLSPGSSLSPLSNSDHVDSTWNFIGLPILIGTISRNLSTS